MQYFFLSIFSLSLKYVKYLKAVLVNSKHVVKVRLKYPVT